MSEKERDNFLLEYKRRLSDVHVYSITLVVVAVVIGVAIFQYKQKLDYRNYLESTFQQAFYETVDYVKNVDNLFGKLEVTTTSAQRVNIFTDLYKNAGTAQENLGRLPYSHASIDKSMKFLSQLSDFSYKMIDRMAQGRDLTEEEVNNINNLTKYAKTLSQDLENVREEVNSGQRINWKKIEKEGEKQLLQNTSTSAVGSLNNSQKDFEDYPAVIYDGPFSDHIQQLEPEYTRNMPKISETEAKKVASSIVGGADNIELVFKTEVEDKYIVPVYRFDVTKEGSKNSHLTIDITQNGGVPLWMLNYSNPVEGEARISIEDGKQIAGDFLNKIGFKDMEVNYYESNGSYMIYNFAYSTENVTVYSDLIKVKVSLNDGSIAGFESLGYIMMHKNRTINSPQISEETARSAIAKDFEVERVSLALIPKDSKEEVLCYEFLGKLNDREYLVYMNVKDNTQERILQVFRGPNGVFTQ